MLSSAQALVWDEQAGEYRVWRVGEELGGARLAAIAADHVVVERAGMSELIALVEAPQARVNVAPVRRTPATVTMAAVAHAPAPAASPALPAAAPVVPAPPAPAMVPAPLAPPAMAVAPAPTAPAAPVAPQHQNVALQQSAAPAHTAAPATEAESATTVEVIPPEAPPVAVQHAPAPAAQVPPAAAPPPFAPAPLVAAERRARAVARGPYDPSHPLGDDEAVLLRRPDFERQMGDFERLGQQVAIAPSPRGGYEIAALQPGCYVESLGLRSGDVILAVDGRPIHSPDDAARAWAWLRVTDRFTVDVLRYGQRVQLRFQLG